MSRRSEHTTKVFVGSLPPNVTAEDLRQLFAPYGAIAECDIANRCGFLHLEDKDLAEKAINELNNSTFMGARISVERGRVKPRGDRRMRGNMGGGRGGMGRKRDMGPYSRDGGGYGRGGMHHRNGGGGGNYRDDYRNFDEYRDYERYDDRYDRRPPMYDDGRGGGNMGSGGGYMNDRNSYGNGYDRRLYDDRNVPYAGNNMPPNRPYDDNRMPSGGPGGYEDRRPAMGDRRPLIDDQTMNQSQMRPPTFDRPPQPQNDMFSRRDGPPKPLTGGFDRTTQGNNYSYGNTNNATNYPNAPPQQTGGSYGAPMNTYNQAMQGGGGGGYSENRGAPNQSYDNRGGQPQLNNPGYASAQGGYNATQAGGPTAGGYGDNYGMRSQNNSYDTAYPPLPQQRGFAGGNAPGPHRDMRVGGRF